MKICSIEGCGLVERARGFCNTHYKIRWKAGEFGNFKGRPKCRIDGCGKRICARSLCKSHYNRLMTYGDPLGGNTFIGAPMQWIHDHINFDGDECLIWPFGKDHGYGCVRFNGVPTSVHCLLLEMIYGPKPTPKHVARHLCGMGGNGCVNPRHLVWGTEKENHADRIIHGTSNRGERHRSCKLSEQKVLDIRKRLAAGERQIDLAREYGVNQVNICNIKRGKNWGWLETPAE